MKENVIQAQVIKLAITSLQYDFAVQIIKPIMIPTEIYSISAIEILMTASHPDMIEDVLYSSLYRKILIKYNEFVENSPILDMIDDPDKYKIGSQVKIDFVTFLNGIDRT